MYVCNSSGEGAFSLVLKVLTGSNICCAKHPLLLGGGGGRAPGGSDTLVVHVEMVYMLGHWWATFSFVCRGAVSLCSKWDEEKKKRSQVQAKSIGAESEL